ncbi:MAG TPA: JAB domain-containing protein [Planctomycetota bacterium]|jgi:hypothetical protein
MHACAENGFRAYTAAPVMGHDLLAQFGAEKCPVVNSAGAIAAVFAEIATQDREVMVAGAVNSQCRLLYWNLISVGTGDHLVLRIGDAFYGAVRSMASAIFLVHNHPSGCLEPSDADLRVTRDTAEASLLIGYPLLDHIILSRTGHCSIMTPRALRRVRHQAFAATYLREAKETGPSLGTWGCPRCGATNDVPGARYGVAPKVPGLCHPGRCQRCGRFAWLHTSY